MARPTVGNELVLPTMILQTLDYNFNRNAQTLLFNTKAFPSYLFPVRPHITNHITNQIKQHYLIIPTYKVFLSFEDKRYKTSE